MSCTVVNTVKEKIQRIQWRPNAKRGRADGDDERKAGEIVESLQKLYRIHEGRLDLPPMV